jgi:uncharacterized repeat protein (TIGR01451 family)
LGGNPRLIYNAIIANQAYALNVLDGSTLDVDSILWSMDGITLYPGAWRMYHLSTSSAAARTLMTLLLWFHIGSDSAARRWHGSGADRWVCPMGFGYDLGAFEHHDAALSLLKTPDLSGANVGVELTYQIVLTSSGAGDNDNVILTDTLDAWQRVTAVDPSEGTCTIEDPDLGGRSYATLQPEHR